MYSIDVLCTVVCTGGLLWLVVGTLWKGYYRRIQSLQIPFVWCISRSIIQALLIMGYYRIRFPAVRNDRTFQESAVRASRMWAICESMRVEYSVRYIRKVYIQNAIASDRVKPSSNRTANQQKTRGNVVDNLTLPLPSLPMAHHPHHRP